MKTSNNNLYTTLDSLLDTRFALLSLIKPDNIPDILKTYHNRTADNFQPIGDKLFRFLYKRRTKELLTISKPTQIIKLIQDYISEAIMDTDNDRPILFINVYPYKLTDNEVIHLKENLLPYFINAKNIVIMNKHRIIPTWFNENVNFIVDYYGLDMIGDLLAVTNNNLDLLNVTTVVPPILYDKKDGEYLIKIKKNIRPVTKLEYIPIETFSINLKSFK